MSGYVAQYCSIKTKFGASTLFIYYFSYPLHNNYELNEPKSFDDQQTLTSLIQLVAVVVNYLDLRL